MTITTELKKINFMSQEQYDALTEKKQDELYAVELGVNTASAAYVSEVASSFSPLKESFETLTLGASGASYTAPEDGYVNFQATASSAGAAISIDTGVKTRAQASASNEPLIIFAPVKKGTSYVVEYSGSMTPDWLRFVFTE